MMEKKKEKRWKKEGKKMEKRWKIEGKKWKKRWKKRWKKDGKTRTIRNRVIRNEIKVEEIKRHIKKQIKILLTHYAHVSRMNARKHAPYKTKREDTKGKTQNQIREDIEDRGQTWIEIHATETWKGRDDWRYLCNN